MPGYLRVGSRPPRRPYNSQQSRPRRAQLQPDGAKGVNLMPLAGKGAGDGRIGDEGLLKA